MLKRSTFDSSNNKNIEKMTISLNKIMNGYYSKKIDSINVVCAKIDKGWEGFITDENKSEESYVLYKCYAETKREVYEMLTKEIKKW